MSFREKSAWISLLLLFVLGGIYFGNFARILAGQHALSDLHLFFALIVALIVAEVVLHVAIAIRSPRDDTARARRQNRRHPADRERDRARQILAVARGGVPHRRGVRRAARPGVPVRPRSIRASQAEGVT